VSKFKVGDRVRAKNGHYTDLQPGSSYNLPRSVGVVVYSGDGFLKVGYGDLISPPVIPNSFELAAAGPIRTVTRREIVDSVQYGIFIRAIPGGVTLGDGISKYSCDASDLRAAAKLFNDLADVLEENAEAA